MDVMVFLGRNGCQASSLDPTGANLPGGAGAWTPLRFVRATEIDEIAALRMYGFQLLSGPKTAPRS